MKPGPGRPRSVECDRAIHDAALTEYADRGFDGMSVDAVAARAGVSKATIYRRYPSKVDLVISAAYVVAEELAPKPDTGALRGDLVTSTKSLANLMNHSVLGRTMRQVVADAGRHPDLAEMHEGFVKMRRQGTFAAFDRAIARGELPPDIDQELAADLLAGPLFYRHMVRRLPVDDAYAEQVVDAFLAVYATVPSTR